MVMRCLNSGVCWSAASPGVTSAARAPSRARRDFVLRGEALFVAFASGETSASTPSRVSAALSAWRSAAVSSGLFATSCAASRAARLLAPRLPFPRDQPRAGARGDGSDDRRDEPERQPRAEREHAPHVAGGSKR